MSVELLARSPELSEADLIEQVGSIALEGMFVLDDSLTAPVSGFDSSIATFSSSLA